MATSLFNLISLVRKGSATRREGIERSQMTGENLYLSLLAQLSDDPKKKNKMAQDTNPNVIRIKQAAERQTDRPTRGRCRFAALCGWGGGRGVEQHMRVAHKNPIFVIKKKIKAEHLGVLGQHCNGILPPDTAHKWKLVSLEHKQTQ